MHKVNNIQLTLMVKLTWHHYFNTELIKRLGIGIAWSPTGVQRYILSVHPTMFQT